MIAGVSRRHTGRHHSEYRQSTAEADPTRFRNCRPAPPAAAAAAAAAAVTARSTTAQQTARQITGLAACCNRADGHQPTRMRNSWPGHKPVLTGTIRVADETGGGLERRRGVTGRPRASQWAGNGRR